MTANLTLPVPLDYTSRDYSAIFQSLVLSKRAQLPQWTSESPNDFGMVLIGLFSYLGDILSYYTDRIANEAFLATAVQRSSVFNIARMLDYAPSGNTAATTTLQFTIANNTGPVTIPAATQVQTVPPTGFAPIVFETDTALVIQGAAASPAVYTATVTATQGITITSESVAVSTGAIDQTYSLFQNPVIDLSAQVFVDEGLGAIAWTFFSHLIDAGPLDRAFTTSLDEFNVTSVLFGDGVNGRVPASGGIITCTYRLGAGAAGNVGLPNTAINNSGLVQLVNPVVINGITQPVTAVVNTIAATGGADTESLDSVRVNAPKSLAAINRAVTLADYAALAIRAGAAKAAATATNYTTVLVAIAPPAGTGSLTPVASPVLKTAVLAYLQTRSMVNVTVTITDPTYVGVFVTANVTVQPTYRQSAVQANVVNNVTAVLAYTNVDFGTRISQSAIYAAINGTEGVAYGIVTTLATTNTVTVGDVVPTAAQIPYPAGVTINASGGVV